MGLNSQIVDLSQVYKTDEDLVGKKAHELGILWKLGIPLPEGFVITTGFFKEFLRLSGIDKDIKKVQALDHPAISDSIKKLFLPIQKRIMQIPIQQALSAQLHRFYRELSGVFREKSLSVFSSSVNNKSIAFFNVKGDANLILKIKKIWSLCLENLVAILVQENIEPKVKRKVFTNNPILDKKLTKDQMDKLTNYCKIIQKNFYFPKEIEYVIKKGKIFITKVSPFTGIVNECQKPIILSKQVRIVIKGIPISPGIATGRVKILTGKFGNSEIKRDEIAILPDLDFSLFKQIGNAKAVIIDSVLRNSLDKNLCKRGFHVPTVIGTKNAAKTFRNGNVITVNGVNGQIYSGGLTY